MIKLSRFGLLIIAMVGASACTQLGQSPKADLIADIEHRGEEYFFTLENTSARSIPVADIIFSSPELSGHMLYIYDPSKKRLQEAYAETFRIGQPNSESLPKIMLNPGQSITNRFSQKYIEGFFFSVPNCYYMIYAYRSENKLLTTAPSKPMRVCDE